MKKIISVTIIIFILLLNVSCKDKTLEETITSEVNNSMKVIINNHEYNVNLEDNQTTKELLNKVCDDTKNNSWYSMEEIEQRFWKGVQGLPFLLYG